MSINAHLESLETKHRVIKTEITQELARPESDGVKLQTLKRKKLAIKDSITKIKTPHEGKSIH